MILISYSIAGGSAAAAAALYPHLSGLSSDSASKLAAAAAADIPTSLAGKFSNYVPLSIR